MTSIPALAHTDNFSVVCGAVYVEHVDAHEKKVILSPAHAVSDGKEPRGSRKCREVLSDRRNP